MENLLPLTERDLLTVQVSNIDHEVNVLMMERAQLQSQGQMLASLCKGYHADRLREIRRRIIARRDLMSDK